MRRWQALGELESIGWWLFLAMVAVEIFGDALGVGVVLNENARNPSNYDPIR